MDGEKKGRRFYKLYDDVMADLGFNNKLLAYLKMMKIMDHKTGKLPIPLRVIADDFGLSKSFVGRLYFRARWDKHGTVVGQESQGIQGLDDGQWDKHGTVVGKSPSEAESAKRNPPPDPPIRKTTTKALTTTTKALTTTTKALTTFPPKPKPEKPKKKRKVKSDYGTPEFHQYWLHHPPTAGSRFGAWEKWQKYVEPHIEEEGELFIDDMIDAIEMQKAFKVHMDSIGEFCSDIPMFERWAKEKRWENKPEIPEKKTSARSDAFADWGKDDG
ncbi:hypothetical protein LCGC14_1018130 [marine sediment metagenome]|uniref:Uncharacterized protein n=1 Tax=marine sediment metagenome TaxID=412755 RepID=A0A0F9QGI2_9ZZZZ